MTPSADTLGISPEAMFYVVGLERLVNGAAITATDRDEALRITNTFRRQARSLADVEEPKRYIPRVGELVEVRDCLEARVNPAGWRYADAESLMAIVESARQLLVKAAPPFFGNEFFPEEYWDSPLDHGPLLRAYVLLSEPWRIWDLLEVGGLLPDEVETFSAVLPDVLEAAASAVIEAAVKRRQNEHTWQPSTIVTNDVALLHGSIVASSPAIQAIFGAPQKQPPKSSAAPKGTQNDATASQKRQASQGDAR